MRRFTLSLFAASAGLAIAVPAQACRVLHYAFSHIPYLYSRDNVTAAALVHIVKVERVLDRDPMTNSWKAEARVDRVFFGSDLPGTIRFDGGNWPGSCDVRTPPAINESWVAYRLHGGGYTAFPAQDAFAVDSRLLLPELQAPTIKPSP